MEKYCDQCVEQVLFGGVCGLTLGGGHSKVGRRRGEKVGNGHLEIEMERVGRWWKEGCFWPEQNGYREKKGDLLWYVQ